MIDKCIIQRVANDMLGRMISFDCYSEDTIKTNRNRLFGGSPSVIDLISDLPVTQLNEIRFKEGEILRNQIRNTCSGKSIETITGKNAVARKLMAHCMNQGLMVEDNDLLRLFRQKHDSYKPPKTLTPRQREILHTEPFSSDSFLQLRDTLIFIIFGEGNAARVEVEPQRTTIKDIYDNIDGMTLIITGKGGKRRPIRLTFADAEVVRQYIKEWKAILAFYNAEYEQSLFIKKNPDIDPQTGKLSFGLSRGGIYGIFQRFRDKHQELSSVNPYMLRKDAISRMLLIARALNIPFEEVAIRNGHSIEIMFAYYNGIYDLYSECLRRTPEELIQFLKGLWAYCMWNFQANPTDLQHLACANAIMNSLGQLQFILLLQAISSGALRIPQELLLQNGPVFQSLNMNQIISQPWGAFPFQGLNRSYNTFDGIISPMNIAC